MRTSVFLHMVMIAVIVIGSAHKAAADELRVVEFSHPPNYALCTDREDMDQLTDGKVATFPIWTKKEAVGWAAMTPIAIQIELVSAGNVRHPQSGTVRLHSAKGLSAGVDLPRYVDAYARDNEGKLRLVGSSASNSGKLNDKSSHWVDVNIQAATNVLVLVLHAAGDYVFLDEIEWRPAGMGRLPASPRSTSNLRTALEDSTRRLSQILQKTAASEVEEAALSLPTQAMYIWNQNPWKEIDIAGVHQQMNNRPSLIEVRGYSGERESICLGIVVGEAIAINGLQVKVKGLSAPSVKFYEVKSVVATNGKQVYDPLVPLGESGKLSARAGIPVYLWIDFDLVALGPGQHRFEVRLDGGGQSQSIPGVALISAYTGKGTKRLRAVNWAYLSDMPVFRNKSAAARDLVQHGINTFVAHPTEIPGVGLDGSWIVKPESNFQHTVELAKQHGFLLLYMGWNEAKNPLGLNGNNHTLGSVGKERLLRWVGKMSAYLSDQGVPLDRWALYPVDEPNRHGLQLIKAVAQAIKEWNPAVQVYTDPSIHATPSITLSDLQDVESLVDYWQPNLLAVRGRTGDFFKALAKDWWIYGNPKSPAKLASPLHDYRMLAWWAWYYGARGVGFWSYSDTGGSSAWDDVDGRRPDWAVVYETAEGVVSSRRWEAFREGLEDYVLLSGLKKSEVQRNLPSGEQNFDQWDIATIEGVRRALLSIL